MDNDFSGLPQSITAIVAMDVSWRTKHANEPTNSAAKPSSLQVPTD
jgi:hypothetical protein